MFSITAVQAIIVETEPDFPFIGASWCIAARSNRLIEGPVACRVLDHDSVLLHEAERTACVLRAHRIITLVWGLVFASEFTLRVILIYTVSTAVVLAVSPVVLGSATRPTILWTFSYAARSRTVWVAKARASAAQENL